MGALPSPPKGERKRAHYVAGRRTGQAQIYFVCSAGKQTNPCPGEKPKYVVPMDWLRESLVHALLMAWETFWALVFGFAVSAALQVFVSKARMARLFGRANLRSMALATGFGAASSSCSYAAAAAGRSAFTQGAALLPALAFMFASTNLVIELCAVLWILMGWRFVLAEFVGALVLIGLMWGLARLFFPRDLEKQARANAEAASRREEDDACCHHGHADGDTDQGAESAPRARWTEMAGAFVMDWQMLWKEIATGFLIAGFLSALVPPSAWRALFLNGGPAWLQLVENACVGPFIAVASFVCSVGNIPLANLLWSGGISFGGVISFIYADLLIVPLVLIYRKYFGTRAAAYISLVFFLSMAGAGIRVDLLFGALGWIPTGPRPPSAMADMHFAWNYTTWLDLVALCGGAVLVWLHLKPGNAAPGTPAASGHGPAGHAHHHQGADAR